MKLDLRVTGNLGMTEEGGCDIRPGGTFDNSPAFQRREHSGKPTRPEGTIEDDGIARVLGSSAVPAGLELRHAEPGVKTPG